MSLTRGEGIKKVGVILFGLVAGLAAFTVITVSPILLAFFGVWIFHQLGWEQASNSAAHFGFYYIYFFFIGLAAGVTICGRVWSKGFRNGSTTSSSGLK